MNKGKYKSISQARDLFPLLYMSSITFCATNKIAVSTFRTQKLLSP